MGSEGGPTTRFQWKVEIKSRQLRRRRVPTSVAEPFHARPEDLHHPMADEFALKISVFFKIQWLLDHCTPFRARVRCTATQGEVKWEYKEKFQDGSDSSYLSEVKVLGGFPPLRYPSIRKTA